jgi:2-methylcitrate dehydratase PrpD
MKPYACCRSIHASIDALFALMGEADIGSDSIVGMLVHGDAQTRLQFDRHHVASLLEAQFSMPYTLAVAAESGRATIEQFQPLRAEEPEIGRLMAATQVLADRELGPTEYPPLELRLRDGRRLARQIAFAKGAPEYPLTEAELQQKVESLIAPALGAERCRAIVAAVAGLDGLTDCRALLDLLAT